MKTATESAQERAIQALLASDAMKSELAKQDAETLVERKRLITALTAKRAELAAMQDDAGFKRIGQLDKKVKELEEQIEKIESERWDLVYQRSSRSDQIRAEIDRLNRQVRECLPLALAQLNDEIMAAAVRLSQTSYTLKSAERIGALQTRLSDFLNGSRIDIPQAELDAVRAEMNAILAGISQ